MQMSFQARAKIFKTLTEVRKNLVEYSSPWVHI